MKKGAKVKIVAPVAGRMKTGNANQLESIPGRIDTVMKTAADGHTYIIHDRLVVQASVSPN